MNRHLHTIDNASRIYEWKMLGRHLNQFYSIGFMLPTWRSENELSTKARMLGSRASLSKWVGWRPVITSFFKIDNEGHLDGSIYSFQFGFIFSFSLGNFISLAVQIDSQTYATFGILSPMEFGKCRSVFSSSVLFAPNFTLTE